MSPSQAPGGGDGTGGERGARGCGGGVGRAFVGEDGAADGRSRAPEDGGGAGGSTRLPDVATIEKWLKQARERAAWKPRWIEDDSVERASKPSDGAGVRDVASSPRRQREMAQGDAGRDGGGGGGDSNDGADEEDAEDDENIAYSIRLDSSAVFCEAEGAGAQLIFDSVISLEGFAKAPDEGSQKNIVVRFKLVSRKAPLSAKSAPSLLRSANQASRAQCSRLTPRGI